MPTHTTRAYYLRIANGDVYYVHTGGQIERTDLAESAPSDTWRLRGIVRTGPGFAWGTGLIPFASLAAWLATRPALTFKNGRARYTVTDLDHGTVRVWGNTRYRGIVELRRV